MSDISPRRKVRRKKPLRTKPAVVPKQKRIKRREKRGLPTLMPKGLNKWNYILTSLFLALLVVTIVNTYITEFFIIAIKGFFYTFIIQIVIFVEVLLVLLAFETYKIEFVKTSIRIIATILLGLMFFPITLVKYHTRHNVWRILFTGFAIWSLLFAFLSPYFSLIGKYRDLPEGALNEQEVNADWFSSLYQGSAPFYIDGLLDLLDALDLNETLQQQNIAHIRARSGTLGNYLYRWEVYDYYNPTTWEFEGSNDAVLYDLNSSFYNEPAGSVAQIDINQTVYSATTSLQNSLLSLWSTNVYPHIEEDSDWDDNFLDENNTAITSQDGTAKVRLNQRDQFSLSAVMKQLGFVGSFRYSIYFVQDDVQGIINNVTTRTGTNMGTSSFNSTYDNFLQIPDNYETTSPDVVAYARALRDDSLTVYQQIVKDIEAVLLRFGLPQDAQSDNQGQDRAQRLMNGEDYSASAYLALIVMLLRLQGIPTRPVFGFAIGSGSSTERDLTLGHLYAWVECLLPVLEGSEVTYKWGQFQIGPYPHENQLIYCENTLYASYNVSVAMLDSTTNAPLPTQTIEGNEVYLADNDISYTIQAYVSDDSGGVGNVPVSFRAYTVNQLDQILAGQQSLTDVGDFIGTTNTNSSGYATIAKSFNVSAYPIFDLQNPDATSFVILAMTSLTSMDYKGFIIFPVGYIKPLEINATRQSLPNPQNPLESFDYYILQKGFTYNISCYLYEDEAYTKPLVGRNVTYYMLTEDQLQELQTTGNIDITTLTKIGVGKTNSEGFSYVTTYNESSGEDIFASLSLNTTYVVAAQYGQSYNFTVFLILDSLISTVLINDTNLDISTDGLAIGEHVEGLLYLQTPLGAKDYLENENVEIWIVPLDEYQDYDGTITATEYQTTLLNTNSTYGPSGPYKIRTIASTTTNSSGGYSYDFVLNASLLGTGSYKVVIFYRDRWNASDTIIISAPPSLMLSNSNSELKYKLKEPPHLLRNIDVIVCILSVLSLFITYVTSYLISINKYEWLNIRSNKIVYRSFRLFSKHLNVLPFWRKYK